MNTEISIQSKLFPSYPNEEDDMNPGRFGKKLGEYIQHVLEKEHIQVADLYPTDYSYEIRIDQFEFSIYVQAGNVDGETEEFIVFVEPTKPFIRKWFKKIPTKERVQSIYNILLEDFQSNSEIKVL